MCTTTESKLPDFLYDSHCSLYDNQRGRERDLEATINELAAEFTEQLA